MEWRPRVSGLGGWAAVAGRDALLVAAGLAVVYGALCLYMFFRQESYVFFPEKGLTATPKTFGMAYEDLWFQTEDGLSIHGWSIPAHPSRALLLFFHGNAGTLSHRVEKIRLFHDWGFHVLAVDYRGYGESAGSPSEEGTYADARAVLAEALKRCGAAPLVFYGESLGGAVAAELATRHLPRALVLESTFTSVPEMARRLYPWLPVSPLVRIRYDTLKRLRRLPCPLAVLHSPADEIVPYAMGEALFEAARGPKVLLRLAGGHNDGGILVTPEAAEGLKRFLDEQIPPREGER